MIPIFVLWDALVSSLRTFWVEEMDELIDDLNKKENLNAESGRIQSGQGSILRLTGVTKKMKNV